MATRTRPNVWRLTDEEGDWPEALAAYERAVGLLQDVAQPAGPPTTPLSWTYQAAIHGRADADGAKDDSNPDWTNCQHGSWFFLPWHRMYLLAFEQIIQHVLEDDQWSLPYWYSITPGDTNRALVLPPAFVKPRDGGNRLRVELRSQAAKSQTAQPGMEQGLVDALNEPVFETDDGTASFGGGVIKTPNFWDQEAGTFEGTPHGAVHNLIGNDYDRGGRVVRRGLMSSPYFAALDPIFWLHHANIDRQWQVWLVDPQHRNPVDKSWLDTRFTFPAPPGKTASWQIRDVLDLADVGYVYEDEPVPEGVEGAQLAASAPTGGTAMIEPPKTLGATDDVDIAASATVPIDLVAPPADAALDAEPVRYFLRIENIRGVAGAPTYDVYVNLPEGAAPDPGRRAGSFSTFGLAEATRAAGDVDGGLNVAVDITALRRHLVAIQDWDPTRLTVTFVPVVPVPVTPSAAADDADIEEADVRAGRIAVVMR